MINNNEKEIAEKLISFHKKSGGRISHNMRYDFKNSISKSLDLTPLISKLISIGLIRYTFSDRIGDTSLTKEGWEFTTFEAFEKEVKSQEEISRITIEKLHVDLKNAKRLSKWYIPLSIAGIIGGLSGFTSLGLKLTESHSIMNLQTQLDTIDTSVDNLSRRIDVLSDTSTHVSKEQFHQ